MRSIKLVGIVIFSLVTLIGCTKSANNNLISNTISNSPTAVEVNQDTDSIIDNNHITDTIDVNLTINADVIIPKSNAYYEYKVIGKDFDINSFSNLLFENGTGIEIDEKDISNPYIKGIIESNNGGELVIWDNALRYKKDKRIENIHYLIGSKYRYEIENESFTNEELQKITKNESIKKYIEELQNAYNLGKNEKFELLTAIEITADSLIQEQNRLAQKPGYEAEILSGMKESIDNWDGIGNLYYLEYDISKNDIPFYGKKEALIQSSIGGMIYQSSYMCVIISDEGIEYLDIQGAWKIESESCINLISVEDSIKKLKDKYANEIISIESEINKIWLQYIFIPDLNGGGNTTGVLRPYWCFQKSYQDGEDLSGNIYYYYEADRINAATGGDLAYGK